jgi:hypothetical protein
MNIEVVAEKESQISFDELTKCCRNKSRLEELTFGSALKNYLISAVLLCKSQANTKYKILC